MTGQEDATAMSMQPILPAPRAAVDAPPADERPEAGYDLFALLAMLRRKWTWIAATLALFVSLAVVVSLSLTPLYTATAEVLVTPKRNAVIGNNVLAPALGSDILMIESQARILTSDAVLGKVVEKENLLADEEFNGARPATGPRAFLRRLLGRAPEESRPSRAAALNALRKRLDVRRAERTFVLEVRVTSEDPAKAARLANAVAEAYIADQVEARRETSRRVGVLLSERLNELRQQVIAAEARVAEFKRRHAIIATRRDQLENEARLQRLGEELVKARARAAAAKARHDALQAALRAGNAAEATAAAARSPVIARLRADYTRAASRAASLSETLGPRHPRLLAARAEVRRIERLIREELKRLARTIAAEHQAAEAEVAAIARNLEALRKQAGSTNEQRVRLRALEREAAALRKVYETMLNRARESGEAQRLQIPQARLISPALPPRYPSFPKKKMIVALAGLLGLGLGMALALLAAAREDRRRAARLRTAYSPARHPRAIAAVAGRRDGPPVLAGLPALRDMPPDGAARLRHVHDALAAPVGIDRAGFANAVFEVADAVAAHHVVAVGATGGGQGATTLSWALAVAATMRGRRVLVLDADQRHPQLKRLLASQARADVRAVMLGEARPEELLLRDPATGIDLLALAGTADFRPDARRLEAFRHWLAELFGHYDLVVVDSGDVRAGQGPVDLAPFVDAMLLIARPAAPGLHSAMRMLAEAPVDTGVVWNLGHDRPLMEAAQ